MALSLEIDCRERAILSALEKESVSNNIVNIQTCQLIIGDFIIRDQNNEVLYVIERKTMTDLASSISDGRFHEQRSRLLESVKDKNCIVYLLENSLDQIRFGYVNKGIVESAYLNLIFFHGYKVVFTRDHQGTAHCLLTLCKKLHNKAKQGTGSGTGGHSGLIPVKKSVATTQNVFINMLCMIPGVHTVTATKLKEKYLNIANLVKHATTSPDKEKFLATFQLSSKRKIGPVLSAKIFNALMLF